MFLIFSPVFNLPLNTCKLSGFESFTGTSFKGAWLLVTLPPAPPNASNPSILSASSTSNSLFSDISLKSSTALAASANSSACNISASVVACPSLKIL